MSDWPVVTMDTVGHPGEVVKSAFALVIGLLMILSSAAGYAYVRLTMSDETTPAETPADPGLAACQALLALPERDSLDDLDEAILTGLADSENTDLQTAGSTLEALAALPAEQQPAAAPQVTAALTQVAIGCAALGVSFPEPSEEQAEG